MSELLERVIDGAERAVGLGAGQLTNMRTKLQLRALVATELFFRFDQRAPRLHARPFLEDRLPMEGELLLHPLQTALVVRFDTLEHMPGRRVASRIERGEPLLIPPTLLDERGYLVQRAIGVIHRRSSCLPPPAPRNRFASEPVNSFTRPTVRAARRIRAACSRLSIR